MVLHILQIKALLKADNKNIHNKKPINYKINLIKSKIPYQDIEIRTAN
jgi:hypothetical protein